MAETSCLLNNRAGSTCTEGSNPSPSAISKSLSISAHWITLGNMINFSTKRHEKSDEFDAFGSLHLDPETGQSPILFVNWNIGNICTYSCSYCSHHCHDGSHKWPTLDQALRISDKVDQVYKSEPYNKKLISFEILGGEITLWNKLTDLCERIHSKGNRIKLITNGVRNLEWWKKHSRYFTSGVILSYHPEFADYKHITEVSKLLGEEGIFHTILLLAYPKTWQTCMDAHAYYLKYAPFDYLIIQKLLVIEGSKSYKELNQKGQEFSDWPYTDDQLKWIDGNHTIYGEKNRDGLSHELGFFNSKNVKQTSMTSAGEVFSQGHNRWKGWDCNVGIDTLYLEQNGHIRRDVMCRSTPHIGNWRGSPEMLEEVQWPLTPVRCPQSSCHCVHDMAARKTKRF